MLLADMPEHTRVAIAIFPSRTYSLHDQWIMKALKLYPGSILKWHHHFIDKGNGHAATDLYSTYEQAIRAAAEFNIGIRQRLNELEQDEVIRESLILKAEKEVTALHRLAQEEQLMLQEAIRRHASDPRPRLEDFVLPTQYESLRLQLHEVLTVTPYVHLVSFRRNNMVLSRVEEHQWMRELRSSAKTVKWCFREKIARGFGLSGADHQAFQQPGETGLPDGALSGAPGKASTWGRTGSLRCIPWYASRSEH